MIIVEGPDGSGKTTLLAKLGYERRSFKALRGGVGQDSRGNWGGRDEAAVAYAKQILAGHARVAFDRFHLSEMIYGPILRGGSAITYPEAVILRRLLRARGIPIIVCLPPAADALRNVVREGRERPEYQTLDFLQTAYDAWVGLSDHLYDVRYDYTTSDRPQIPRNSTMSTCPPCVIGDPNARFLIIGDRSNGDIDLPFFSIYGYSGLLNKCLGAAGLLESEIALTNAKAANGAERDLGACVLHSTTHIIALGIDAADAVSRQHLNQKYPVFMLPHPRSWSESIAFGYVARMQEIRATA